MDKDEYVRHLDAMIEAQNSNDYANLIFIRNLMGCELRISDDLIDFDTFRRRNGLNKFYAFDEVKRNESTYANVGILEKFSIYKENYLFLGEVSFVPKDLKYKMLVDNEIIEYEQDSENHTDYLISSNEIKDDALLFFDILNKKVVIIEKDTFNNI